MALMQCLLYTLLSYICYSFDTFNHYTFYYESYHYDFESNKHNNMISIIDHFNNSIIFNSSFIITINNNIEIDYLNDNDWSEIYHHYTHTDNNNITPKRRRLWGWFKKRFKKVRQMLRKLFGKVAIPPPRSRVFWNKKWLKRGRYIGYFPGYANQKGLTYKKAEKYCDENFGGLATIFSKRENKIVFGICRSLLKKYKMKRKCKRKCKYILFRGTKCWNHCWIPKVEKLYIQKHWKGHNCWIGIRQGPSSKKSKAFHKWNDQRNVNYKNWSPNEPNYRTLKHCKKIYGSDGGNNKQCDIEHIYDEKCGEILGYKAGHAKVSRSKKQNKLFKGIPVDIQQQIAPIGYARQTKYALVPRAGKWNNARCLSSRIPICQKPRGQVYDKYIAVRAARSQASAEQFCNNWYGSTLATIINDEDNIMAMEACNAIDIKKRSCWIGLARPFKKWNDGIKTKKFSNWAPNEPNNAGWSENCVEVYGGNGKWNDLACVAKRYFLCNLKTELQRMDSKIRKEMIMKRLRRHKDVWSRHRRKEYREKTRKQYGKRMARNKKMQKKMNAMNAWKQRDAFRQNMFNEQYGGFMKKLGINMNSFGGGNGLGHIMRGRRRFRRRVMEGGFEQDVQGEIDLIHDLDDGYDEIPKGKLIELGMNMDDQQMLDTFGVGDYGGDEFVNVKCKLFGGDYGLFEMCIDERGIDVKRYMYVNNESGSGGDGYYGNVSDVSGYYMGYMEYEDFKYKRVLRYENGSLNVGFNGDDDVDSYHLVLMEFVYDFDSNHNRQCWKYLYEFEICMVMELDGYYENGKMVMEIVKENNKIVFPSKMVRFYNDIEWNEINKLYDDKGENRMVVIKCIHMFDAKICIKCIYGMNEDELIPLSYIANVFLHDHYDVH
eukprot:78128_1